VGGRATGQLEDERDKGNVMNRFNRRQFLNRGVIAAGTALFAHRRLRGAEQGRILETKVISQQSHLYHGWPTVARRQNGELLLVWSGGREEHVCPFGYVGMMRSHDEGQTWSWPRVLLDGPIDDRDSGVLETSRGTLLVTTFSSLAYEARLKREIEAAAAGSSNWPAERLKRWRAAHERVSDSQRQKALGVWMIRSTDGGASWSAAYDCLVNSPHGPIQLTDGRLLYAGKQLWRDGSRVGVCQSQDDGRTWQWLAEIPVRAGDDHRNYHELHAVDVGEGRIIAQIRNHNTRNSGETLQSVSEDSGQSWSEPREIGVWGLPSHLLKLNDGRLLMTYGHRRAPFGNQARISSDGGLTWSDPIVISGDGAAGDLGYPSTVQLGDHSLLTVWYESMPGVPKAVLRQAHWTLT
jgi:sialidase-1